MPVRLATEQDREYFAGLLRVINTSTLIHADYAPYVSILGRYHSTSFAN